MDLMWTDHNLYAGDVVHICLGYINLKKNMLGFNSQWEKQESLSWKLCCCILDSATVLVYWLLFNLINLTTMRSALLCRLSSALTIQPNWAWTRTLLDTKSKVWIWSPWSQIFLLKRLPSVSSFLKESLIEEEGIGILFIATLSRTSSVL